MDTKTTEMAHVFGLLLEINGRFAAEADARIDWPNRQIKVEIKEGGRIVYYEIVRLDAEECEADAKKIRRDLERLIISSELPPITLEAAV